MELTQVSTELKIIGVKATNIQRFLLLIKEFTDLKIIKTVSS
tara:strand:+ start:311 stop:436 length:126 start_codon:yes stop_codon:yes gene_type:complete